MTRRPTPDVKPRYCTPRNPDRVTDGPREACIAEALGTPFLPWQRLVSDVFGEIDPDTGTYWYDTLVLTVQRQAGKTTRERACETRNALWGPNRRVWYLAQTGKDASEQFREYTTQFNKSLLAPLARQVRLSNGSMCLTLRNGSTIRPGGTTDSTGHGFQGDSLTLDECWALPADTAKSILDGFLPTTTTRMNLTGVRPRITFCSTEGTAKSTFFNPKLDELRARMDAGDDLGRTCFVDFGIPFGSDPEDLDNIWSHHPGAGWLFDFDQLRDFRDQFGDDAAGWARAFGNIRDTGIVERAIDAALWEDTTGPVIDPASAGRLCFGVAVAMGGTGTAIVACIDTDGPPVVQVVDVLPGIGDAPQRLRELQDTYHAPICIDRRGPSAALADVLANSVDDFDAPRYQLADLKPADAVTAPQAFLSMLEQHAVLHAPDRQLDHEAGIAAKRMSGDAWLWSRKPESNAPTVEAATLALWGYTHMDDDAPPRIW